MARSCHLAEHSHAGIQKTLANFQTLQHCGTTSVFKIWFIVVDPNRGQLLRQSQDHVVSERIISECDYILVQQPGQTVYLPPLVYHAVLTCYGSNVEPRNQFTMLAGIFFADTRPGSVWRERLPVWSKYHHTGHRHGYNVNAVNEAFHQFLGSAGDSSGKRKSKKRQIHEKSKAANAARRKLRNI